MPRRHPSIHRTGRGPVGRGRALAAGLVALIGSAAWAAPALAENSAVVLMYHRFGDSRYPSTNIRIDQFEEHIRELTSGRYKVLGLPEIVAAIKERRPLPDRTVGLSIDDGFLSIYANAWPRLRAAKLPFTLFVATDDVDKRLPDFMSWEQLRELAKAGVTIGAHTASHAHLPRLTSEQVQAEIAKSNTRLRAELGKQPELFAYPYGEFRATLRDIVAKAGYVAAFGQHSGVIHSEGDILYLPRFAMAESYGDRSRVRDALNALPFVVADVSPADPFLAAKDNPPHFGFTVKGEAARALDKLRCFAPGGGLAPFEVVGNHRVEVRLERAFPAGRTRINCTVPADGNRWRWFSVQFLVAGRSP